MESNGCHLPKSNVRRQDIERPFYGFVHGPPGTGKSRLIYWITRLFKCLGWSHGREFLCVAFQNKVAMAMHGTTLHSGGQVGVGGARRTLDHSNVNDLYTRNQELRWVIIDEVGMIADELLGEFELNLDGASTDTRYSKTHEGVRRPFGGYNVCVFGDLYQIPPIPASAALFLPPPQRTIHKSQDSSKWIIQEKKSEIAHAGLDFMWGDDIDTSINYFQELKVQKRQVEDTWYASVLEECREGSLSDESYNFLHGFPTLHCGSWLSSGVTLCGRESCANLVDVWTCLALQDSNWADMQKMECDVCCKERNRRNRLLAPMDARPKQPPYVTAPYIHKNNEPKYHAMLLRASEHAKRERQFILWYFAEDTPNNPMQLAKDPTKLREKKKELLYLHDQHTAGIPGMNLLFVGMKMRTTEKMCISSSSNIIILKHSSCEVVGWELHPGDEGKSSSGVERLLHYVPPVIFARFPNAEWEISSKLGRGVLPIFLVTEHGC